MALYEYRCRHCGAEFEQLRPIEHRNFAHCEVCNRFSGRRVITAPVIRGETVARS